MPKLTANHLRGIVVHLWSQHGLAWVASSALIGLLTLVVAGLLTALARSPWPAVDWTASMTLLGWVGLLLLVQHGLRRWRAKHLQVAGGMAVRRLADGMRLLHPGGQHDPGETTEDAVKQACRTLRAWAGSSVWPSLFDLPLALACFVGLWWLHPGVGAAAFGSLALLGLCAVWLLRHPPRTTLSWTGNDGLSVRDILAQAPSWRALDIQPRLTQQWVQQRQQSLEIRQHALDAVNGIRMLSRTVLLSLVTLLVIMAGVLLGPQGDVVAVLTGAAAGVLATGAFLPLLRLLTHVPHLRGAPEAWRQVERLLSSAAPTMASVLPSSLGGVWAVEGFSASVGSTEAAARVCGSSGMDFTVAPGEVLAVLGRSGSGKSLLLKALSGLQGASHGVVRWGHLPLANWPADELARCVGYLPQEVALLDGTLAENVVRFGAPDRVLLNRALNDAGLLTTVSRWPMGVDTQLGRQGLRLSASWRQRIALAHALYGRPPLLLLDEPSSGLDRSGEAALEQVIRECKSRGSAVVVVSRRPGLLQLADCVLLLRDGQVWTHGPRDQVTPILRPAEQSNGGETVRPFHPLSAVSAELHPA